MNIKTHLVNTRLGVNIDHVATLRQARGEQYPSLVTAAKICLTEGADQITIHLREDRRHIQDTDVESIKLVTKEFNKPLNLEMGCSEDIISIAIATKPNWVCLVPEKREERTTEGGLDLISSQNYKKVEETCNALKKKIPDLKISLFVEGKIDVMKKAICLPVDAVEIHTGDFARSFNEGNEINHFIHSYQESFELVQKYNLSFHAGHGLTNKNIIPLLKSKLFEEYNIGHWIIAESIFYGLGTIVRNLKGLINENRLP